MNQNAAPHEGSARRSAGGVVRNGAGLVVLVEQHANSWSFPKGGIEPGETPLEAAIREIREECGLTDLSLVCELGRFERRSISLSGEGEDMSRPPTERIFFLFETATETLSPQDSEITTALFVSPEEALRLLTHPQDRAFFVSVLPMLERPRDVH